MKTIIRILTASFAASLLLAGCQSKMEEVPTTRTNIVMAPAVYGAFAAPETRAHNLGDNYNEFNKVPDLIKLPIGSTVWLTYRKGEPTAAHAAAVDAMSDEQLDLVNPDWFTWSEPNLQSYMVADAAGFNALYPIAFHTIDEYPDGPQGRKIAYLEVNENPTITNPLYLKDGYYQFRMVYPANMIRKDNLSMIVDNGMYVYANDERYNQTASLVKRIKNNGQGVQNVVLRPMINETARIKVSVKPAANVSKIEMLSQGIEISGLQNPETENGKLAFKWSSMDIKDTLVMKLADKHANAFIKEFTTDKDGVITGHVGVLPTNALSTSCVILINLAVNGVPTQYAVTLYQIKLVHGHSYNLDLEVGLNGNINVMNWANQSWTGEVTLN